jgi:multidrug efflux system membrane fusion protein
MFMNRRYGFRAAVLASICVVAAGCQKAGPPAFTLPPAPVSVATAVSEDVPLYLDEIGQIAASESVTMTPQVSGRIMERRVEDGAEVKKGDLLFVIDPRPFQAQLDAAQAQLAQSKAALELARSQLEMYTSVADARAISKFDLDTKKNAVALGDAQVLAAEAALESARLNLEYCYIHSPVDGRASKRLVDVGNVVTGNQTALLSVQRLDPIYADFIVTEQDLPGVQQDMARGTLKTMVRLPTDPESAAASGELTFLDNAVQSGSGTVNLRATLANADHRFWPGQFVRVRLVLAMKQGAVLIPNEATQIGQKGPFVYVVKPDATAELRQVKLGQRHGDRIVIETGIAGGEQVVVTGQLAVNPGAKVRIEGGAPAAVQQTGGGQTSGTGAGRS